MALHVHLEQLADVPEAQRACEDALDPSIQLTTGAEPPEPARYRVLISGFPGARLLDASPELETVIIPWAGLSKRTATALLERPQLRAHNLHHNASATAELAVGLLLAVAKSIPALDHELRGGDWGGRTQWHRSLQLEGRTALVVGWGAIGQRVGRALRGIGMNVLGIRRSGGRSEPGVYASEALHDLLPRADALVLCVPATPETRGLIGERELALLPANALLVNVARGAVVDEAALYRALESRQLFGAGLDVWYRYPGDGDDPSSFTPANVPLHELDNVVRSPHRGGHVSDTEHRRFSELAKLVNAAARGEPLPNRVDPERGY